MLLGVRLLTDHHRRRAVDHRAGIAGGDHAPRLEGRPQARHLLQADVVHDVRVVLHLHGCPGSVDLHRHRLDLLVEPAGIASLLGIPVGSKTEGIGLLARDVVAPAQLLGGVGHGHPGARVVKPHQQRILQMRSRRQGLDVDRTVLLDSGTDGSPPVGVKTKRILHALGTADDHERPALVVPHAGQHHLRTDGHRLGAAAADPRHGQRRHVVAEPAAPAHPLGAVDRVAVAVLGHAHHDVADQALVDRRVLERGLDGHAAELRGGETREQPGLLVVDQNVGPRRSPGPVENDDGIRVAHHGSLPPLLVHEGRRDPGTVLDEVLHADVVVHGVPAARETVGFYLEAGAERFRQAIANHVHQDRIDGQ